MKRHKTVLVVAAFVLAACCSFQSYGQFQSKGIRVGISGGFLGGKTEKVDDKLSEAVRGFVRYNVQKAILFGSFAVRHSQKG